MDGLVWQISNISVGWLMWVGWLMFGWKVECKALTTYFFRIVGVPKIWAMSIWVLNIFNSSLNFTSAKKSAECVLFGIPSFECHPALSGVHTVVVRTRVVENNVVIDHWPKCRPGQSCRGIDTGVDGIIPQPWFEIPVSWKGLSGSPIPVSVA